MPNATNDELAYAVDSDGPFTPIAGLVDCEIPRPPAPGGGLSDPGHVAFVATWSPSGYAALDAMVGNGTVYHWRHRRAGGGAFHYRAYLDKLGGLGTGSIRARLKLSGLARVDPA